MSGTRVAVRTALLMLMALGLLAPHLARAIEIQLPGERSMELHGFYELRLQVLGEDWPGNGMSMSQFRHVLNLETENEIFPDGFGPFDFMMAYTRWIVQYECAYQGGCVVPGFKNQDDLFNSYNFYGGDRDDAIRLPRNLKKARSGPIYAGGLLEMRFRPGTIRSPRESITSHVRIPASPSDKETGQPRRFRDAINPAGILNNPNPLAVLANLNQRSKLDEPVRVSGTSFVKNRAGAYASPFHLNYLQAARADLGEDNFRVLRNQFLAGDFLANEQSSGSALHEVGQLRALNAAVFRGEGSRMIACNTSGEFQAVGDLGPEVSIKECRDSLLGLDPGGTPVLDIQTIDPVLQDLYEIEVPEGTEDLNLLETRPDRNRYEALSNQLAPELLEAVFGSSHLSHEGVLAYLATIDTPIRPDGYFQAGGEALDGFVSPFAVGLASNLAGFDSGTLPAGAQKSDALKNNVVPGFFGPDGVGGTADDLPFIASTGNGLVQTELDGTNYVGSTWENSTDTATGLRTYSSVAGIEGAVDPRFNDQLVVLYAERNSTVVAFAGCSGLGGVAQNFVPGQEGFDYCLVGEEQIPFDDSRLTDEGCAGTRLDARGGVNENDRCIELNLSGTIPGRGVHIDVIDALGRPQFRPSVAGFVQADLTDFVTRGVFGRPPPARPQSPDSGLFFNSAGYQKLQIDSSSIVSSLDLDFNVDELRWGHGASDDEHEFREGYLEFELADSQLWARVGKLIMVWGKTELFRNQDRLNPVDLSNGVITRLEEARVGQWAAQLVFSPEAWMKVGPVEDLRLELAVIYDDFEPTDLGKCGEASALALVCLKGFGAYAHGLTAIGVAGEVRPDKDYNGIKAWDFGLRLEGRWDRFTFAVTDFWGWDDGFYLDVVNRYGRRVDPVTGAPVNSVGSLSGAGGCKYRSADGSATEDSSLSVGPDGDAATTHDNLIPSIGNCLLFDNPSAAGEAQTLRMGSDIAASHSVNQTLFHTLCTLTFDPDQGFCVFDRLTNPEQFQLVGVALASTVLAGPVLVGVETLRFANDPFSPEAASGAAFEVLSNFDPDFGQPSDGAEFELRPEQGALLGCGPSFASACGPFDVNFQFGGENADGSVAAALGIRGVAIDMPGGVDFMNADGSVLTEDFTVLKAGAQPNTPINASSSSALVGTRNNDYDALGNDAAQLPLRWEAGVTVGGLTQRQLQREEPLSPDVGGGFLQNTVFELPDSGAAVELYDVVDAQTFAGLSLVDRAAVVSEISEQSMDEASDGWIEPLPWALDPEALALGEVRYLAADQNQLDLRCSVLGPDGERRERDLDPGSPTFGNFTFTDEEKSYCTFRNGGWTPRSPDSSNIRNDPTDPTNPENVFIDDYAQIAELCTAALTLRTPQPLGENEAFMQPFGGAVDLERGCTELERFSANLERFIMTLEIVGADRHLDPPETVDEILAMLDGDYSNDAFGDPIAGADGIFTLNARVFNTDVSDVQGVVNGSNRSTQTFQQAIGQAFDPADGDDEDLFFSLYDPESCITGESCHLQLNERHRDALTGSSRSAISALPLSTQARDSGSGQLVRFSPLYLARNDPGKLAALFSGESVVVPLDPRSPETSEREIRMDFSQRNSLLGVDLNGDSSGIRDLDEDNDGVWDGTDDFSPGPISDDAILCGSGIPGDILQDAAQFELYSAGEEQKFEERFGEDPNDRTGQGLPFRSPVYCGGSTGLLGATTQTLPFVRAGGDGNFGRRDFLWHGGQQVAFRYQKRNVFGFALDFAEDVTKTSWGIEMSYLSNGLLGNTNSFSGTEDHDQLTVSVSVDRPTFFNFLNPNRSFFLNFQFFMRYIFDYDGGGSAKDGTFGSAPRAFSVPIITFTFFTGYFQDRLAPRMTMVFDPDTQTGGVLWGLTYRWSGNFTTSLAMNQFFGNAESLARADFPIVQYGDPKTIGGSFRGITPVVNRDTVFANVRYSW